MAGVNIFAGDTAYIDVTVTSGGSPKNLTGAAIKWQLAKSVTSSVIITKTLSDGITMESPLTGVFTIFLSSAETTGKEGQYYHEAQVVDQNGDSTTVLTGNITFTKTLVN